MDSILLDSLGSSQYALNSVFSASNMSPLNQSSPSIYLAASSSSEESLSILEKCGGEFYDLETKISAALSIACLVPIYWLYYKLPQLRNAANRLLLFDSVAIFAMGIAMFIGVSLSNKQLNTQKALRK
jgi:hypothetical protein